MALRHWSEQITGPSQGVPPCVHPYFREHWLVSILFGFVSGLTRDTGVYFSCGFGPHLCQIRFTSQSVWRCMLPLYVLRFGKWVSYLSSVPGLFFFLGDSASRLHFMPIKVFHNFGFQSHSGHLYVSATINKACVCCHAVQRALRV